MTQSNVCVLYNTPGKNGFPAVERDSDSGLETSVRNEIYSIQRSNEEVLKLVLGDEQLTVRFEAGYVGGRNGGSDAGPSLRRMKVLFEVSAGLQEKGQGSNHLGEAAGIGEIRLVRGLTGYRWGGQQEGHTFLDWPRMFGFGEKTPMEPEVRIDLFQS